MICLRKTTMIRTKQKQTLIIILGLILAILPSCKKNTKWLIENTTGETIIVRISGLCYSIDTVLIEKANIFNSNDFEVFYKTLEQGNGEILISKQDTNENIYFNVNNDTTTIRDTLQILLYKCDIYPNDTLYRILNIENLNLRSEHLVYPNFYVENDYFYKEVQTKQRRDLIMFKIEPYESIVVDNKPELLQAVQSNIEQIDFINEKGKIKSFDNNSFKIHFKNRHRFSIFRTSNVWVFKIRKHIFWF